MIYSVHQPQYLPWVGFFDKIDQSDCFVVLDQVQYKHREFQNRNKIRTKDGWMWLTVPVSFERGERICDIRIDNSQDWRREHLKSLNAWYAKSGFFGRFFPFFESVYVQEWQKLADLNVFIIRFILKNLGIDKPLYFESALNAGGEKTQRIINIGKTLGADIYLSGAGGKDYLEEEKFAQEGLELRYQNFVHPRYAQLFTKTPEEFITNLSILDLLFNEGHKSLEILRAKQ